MENFVIKPLTPETWNGFAALVARHNGVWGRCWCMGIRGETPRWGVLVLGNPADKARLVQAGRTHPARVFDGEVCVGWWT